MFKFSRRFRSIVEMSVSESTSRESVESPWWMSLGVSFRAMKFKMKNEKREIVKNE